MDSTLLYQVAVDQVDRALANLDISDTDWAALDRLHNFLAEGQQGSFFELATEKGIEITPGIWAFYMRLLIRQWEKNGQEAAVALPVLRELYTGSAEGHGLLDRAAEALETLSWVAYEPSDEGEHSARLMNDFYQLALATEQLSDVETAYNLAALALDLGEEQGAKREEVARYALALAIAADQIHQVATCSVHLAAAVAAAADADGERRLEAFDCCETSLERLALAPEGFRAPLASMLAEVVGCRDFLRKLQLPLLLLLPPDQQPPEVLEVLGFKDWPERVSRKPLKDWIDSLRGIFAAQVWDIELDKVRLSLEQMPKSRTAHADWTAWTVDHDAYRRAVPHHRSFLREAEFDSHLLVLTHEITHVLSLIGGIGTALTCLRVATIEAETTLWSLVPGILDIDLQQRIVHEGVAPLEDGDAGSLFRAEQGLELTLKAHILQDLWTPWLEGLAIFGETAADPAFDPVGIGQVTSCLRNFLDFHPPPDDEPGSADYEAKTQAAYVALAAEFEARCSTAIARRGPIRLSAYCRTSEVPYLAGLIAVRSVVSAWRATTGRALTGTETFGLLLHATRHGTFEAVPDLSLRSELFASAALDMMVDWACRLAQLPREDIEEFLAPPQHDGLGRQYRWKGGRLVRSASEKPNAATEQSTMTARRVYEALSSLTRPEDIERFSPLNGITRWFLTEGAQIIKKNAKETAADRAKLAQSFLTAGSLLPVGRTAAKFFVNIDETAPTSYLASQIRTTEAHVSDGNPSVNGFWFPIDHSGGELIAKAFRHLGNPRIQVARLIDLGGFFLQAWPRPGTHLLAFSYGDWFEIRGTNGITDTMLNADADYRSDLRNLVRARLFPTPIARTELDVIARGKRGAERTRDWIDRSLSWSLNDCPIAAEIWAEHVRTLAAHALSESARQTRQKGAARALVTALVNDGELAEQLATKDFDTLTEHAPEMRSALVNALFETAQAPRNDDAITTAVARFTGFLTLFTRGPHGWDVRPAVRQAK